MSLEAGKVAFDPLDPYDLGGEVVDNNRVAILMASLEAVARQPIEDVENFDALCAVQDTLGDLSRRVVERMTAIEAEWRRK